MADAIEQDALRAILGLLPARDLASAACVCRSWYNGVQAVCSRPCIFSALSLQPNLKVALEEVLEKILAETFRPQFVIVFAGEKFNLSKIVEMLKSKLPGSTVAIGCHAAGLIGLDVATSKQKEVVFQQSETRQMARQRNAGIVLTLGCFPGVQVETLALKNSYSEPEVKMFVEQSGASRGSSGESPLSIIVLAKPRSNVRSLLEKLDEAFIGKNVVAGGLCIDNVDSCLFSQCFMPEKHMVNDYERRGEEFTKSMDIEFETKAKVESYKRVKSKKVSTTTPFDEDIVGMVFRRMYNRFTEDRKFLQSGVVASESLVPVGHVYIVVSVRETFDPILQQATTWLTCKRENGVEKLDGISILEDLQVQVGYLCVGTLRQMRRANKLGQKEVFNLHQVQGADEEYLYVDGNGIKTGDKLRFYCTDAATARLENTRKMEQLENSMKSQVFESSAGPSELRKSSQVGGLMFSCIGRGEAFFGEANVDSGAFLQKFPDVSLSGMFCLGEIGPASVLPWQSTNSSTTQQVKTTINFYSNVSMLFSQDI